MSHGGWPSDPASGAPPQFAHGMAVSVSFDTISPSCPEYAVAPSVNHARSSRCAAAGVVAP